MYQELLDMERKLDWTMSRKKVEIEDALARVQPVRQISFLWFCTAVSNTWMRIGAKDAPDIPQSHCFRSSVATAGNW